MSSVGLFRFVVLGALVCAAGVATGDSIDQAEADRRGVSVEVIKLETARARIATLEKQNKELAAEVADLKKQLAAAKQEAAVASKALEEIRGKTNVAPAADGGLLIKRLKLAEREILGKKLTTATIVFDGLATADSDFPSLARFTVRDTRDNGSSLSLYFYADKKKFGDQLMALKRGQLIRCRGTVIKIYSEFGFEVDAIEVVQPTTAPAKAED